MAHALKPTLEALPSLSPSARVSPTSSWPIPASLPTSQSTATDKYVHAFSHIRIKIPVASFTAKMLLFINFKK